MLKPWFSSGAIRTTDGPRVVRRDENEMKVHREEAEEGAFQNPVRSLVNGKVLLRQILNGIFGSRPTIVLKSKKISKLAFRAGGTKKHLIIQSSSEFVSTDGTFPIPG